MTGKHTDTFVWQSNHGNNVSNTAPAEYVSKAARTQRPSDSF